jgi:hypothetical protein
VFMNQTWVSRKDFLWGFIFAPAFFLQIDF